MASYVFEEGTVTPPRPVQKKQLLVNVVDGLAKFQANALYAEYPYSATSYEAGYRKITYALFANAVNGLAWHLHDILGPGKDFPTLAYIGPNDLRYNALLLAAVKAGYKLLLSSPRNSLAAHQNLFNLTNCEVMLTPSPYPPAVTAIASSCKLRIIEVPSVEELLTKQYPHYPYNKTFAAARNEPLAILHTSGTTGLPKPIVLTHDYAASAYYWGTMESPEGYVGYMNSLAGSRLFLILPPFHAAGLFTSLIYGIFNQVKIIHPLSGAFPSARLVMEGLKHTTADAAFLAPPFVVEMYNDPEMFDFLSKHLESILYAGGAIPSAVGEEVAKKMKLWTIVGMTEAGVLPSIRPQEWPVDGWSYFKYDPASMIEFEQRSENLYEAVIVRHPDPEQEQPIFKVFPELKKWGTKDLYERHPTVPDAWMHRGRADDIIVFLNGEKTNPVSMELHVSKHPEVRSALVVGQQRLEAALLIELETDKRLTTAERAAAIERIWPTIEEANQECPHHAKVSKSHILFTDVDKPMLRAGKGTVQRPGTLALYTKEIDALYEDAEKAASALPLGVKSSVDIQDAAAVSSFLRETILEITSNSFKDDDDFFTGGMDSLQAIQLTRNVKQGLALSAFEITSLYTNPSIASLTKAIQNIAAQHNLSKESSQESRQKEMTTMLEEYKSQVDVIAKESKPLSNGASNHGRVFVLTGSTGALGSYILQILLDDATVSHVYCLNRGTDSRALQLERNGARGLPTEFPSSKVTFLSADLSKDNLGLEPEVYQKIRASATEIIHNAWPVNFNIALSTFRPQLTGVVNLIKLSATGAASPSLIFLSSISSVGSLSGPPIPEEVITDLAAPLPMGYGESKYLAERIIDHASTVLPDLNLKFARVGQIAGPAVKPGSWNKWEWLPSIVISSLHLGVIPESIGGSHDEVDWVPVDLLAVVIIELVLAPKKSTGAGVFHPHNPRLTKWSTLLPSVIETLSTIAEAKGQPKITAVPFETWLQRVRASAEKVQDSELEKMLVVNPAIKLLSFYEGMTTDIFPKMDVKKAVSESKQLQELQGVKPEWMVKWVHGWVGN